MGFKLAIYPCAGFIHATIAMKKSYEALRTEGSDLGHCGRWQIKDFFEVNDIFTSSIRVLKLSRHVSMSA